MSPAEQIKRMISPPSNAPSSPVEMPDEAARVVSDGVKAWFYNGGKIIVGRVPVAGVDEAAYIAVGLIEKGITITRVLVGEVVGGALTKVISDKPAK